MRLRRPTDTYLFLHADGRWRRRLPLPWKTRLRLRATGVVDAVCVWLCEHHLEAVATGLWRACGLW